MSAQRRRALLLGWAVLVWVAIFWRLGEPTFWDPDEAHYAVTTRELLASGDWLAPTYNGQPFFDKPILFHQLQALTTLATSDPELGARLTPALAALGLIGVTWWLGAALWGAETAYVAALLLTISPALVGLTRYAILDMLFTAFLFGGAAVLTVSALGRRPALQWVGYVLLALAVLTKGPVGLVLVALVFVVSIAVSGELRTRLLRLHWLLGAALVVGLSAPWFVYMYERFGAAFVTRYVLDENLLLFARAPYKNQPGWSFYLQIVAVGMLPWTPALLGRLFDWCVDVWSGRANDLLETLLWCWVGAIIAFFSVSEFKLDHYVFPVAPALCLLCARSWAQARADSTPGRHVGVRLGFALVGPTLIIVGIALGGVIAGLALPVASWALPVLWVVTGMMLTLSRRTRIGSAPGLVAVAFGALYAVVITAAAPVIERQKVVADVARWVVEHAEPSAQICSYRLNRWNNSLLFYANRHVTITDEPEGFQAFLTTTPRFLCVMPQSGYDELATLGMHLPVVHRRDGLWATSGRSLRRTGATRTPFLVVSGP